MLLFFGVHGFYATLPLFFPIWMGYIGENTSAIAAVKEVPLIVLLAYLAMKLNSIPAPIGLIII